MSIPGWIALAVLAVASCALVWAYLGIRGDRARVAAAQARLDAVLADTPSEPHEVDGSDTCQVVQIDGSPVVLRGSGEMTEIGFAHMAEVVAAAKRRYASEHPDLTELPPAGDSE